MLLQRIGLDVIQEEEQALTRRALRGLSQIPGLKVYGIKDQDSPRFAQKGGVIVFDLKGLQPSLVAKKLAEQGGIGVCYGCHCAHLLIKHLLNINPLLAHIQGLILILFPRLALPGLVRVSLGIENTQEDVDTLLHVLGKIALKPRSGGDKQLVPTHDGTPKLSQAEFQQQMNDFVHTAAERVYNGLPT